MNARKNEYKYVKMNPDNPDCICFVAKPDRLCKEHQCCWKCGTQSVRIRMNKFSWLWLCNECNRKGDWCRCCRNLIGEEGKCTPGCECLDYEGIWGCKRCNTWRADEKYCGICGPDPADLAADEKDV